VTQNARVVTATFISAFPNPAAFARGLMRRRGSGAIPAAARARAWFHNRRGRDGRSRSGFALRRNFQLLADLDLGRAQTVRRFNRLDGRAIFLAILVSVSPDLTV